LGRFQLRAIVVLTAAAACAVGATAALADSFDDALATCGQQKLEQPFAALGDTNTYFAVPGGSLAAPGTTAPVCVTSDMPTIRFLAHGHGVLKVEALFKGANGRIQALPVGPAVSGGPSPAFRLRLSAMRAVSKSSPLGVAFRFVPVVGSWTVDRVYVDPLKECC
jgi:hypothetical protein